MLNLIQLLGIPAGPPSALPPHFWFRALAASAFFLASLWVMDLLFSRRLRRGSLSGGGGLRRPQSNGLIVALDDDAAAQDDSAPTASERPAERESLTC